MVAAITEDTVALVGGIVVLALGFVVVLGLAVGGPAHPYAAFQRGWDAIAEAIGRGER